MQRGQQHPRHAPHAARYPASQVSSQAALHEDRVLPCELQWFRYRTRDRARRWNCCLAARAKSPSGSQTPDPAVADLPESRDRQHTCPLHLGIECQIGRSSSCSPRKESHLNRVSGIQTNAAKKAVNCTAYQINHFFLKRKNRISGSRSTAPKFQSYPIFGVKNARLKPKDSQSSPAVPVREHR